MKKLILFYICVCFFGNAFGQEKLIINKAEYLDKLQAFWLAQSMANWTGLRTENQKIEPPFHTDEAWGTDAGKKGKTIDFVIQDPWKADDDTDIELIYLHLLHQHQKTTLTPEEIRDGWQKHINRYIWVSNKKVRQLMDEGHLPPETGRSPLNPHSLKIDAQLTTEIFGALAPGMPEKSLKMAYLPIRTSADGHAALASEFFVLLHSLSVCTPEDLKGKDQVQWLMGQARQFLPDSSKTADIVDFVWQEYAQNPDKENWEATRDKIYERYQLNAEKHGFTYLGKVESSINFATAMMAFLYGEGDYKKTIRVATLSGWDSDNPAATLGGLLGLMNGTKWFQEQFPDEYLSQRYWASRTRDNYPDYLPEDPDADDNFEFMAKRMEAIIDLVVQETGGEVKKVEWIVPAFKSISENR